MAVDDRPPPPGRAPHPPSPRALRPRSGVPPAEAGVQTGRLRMTDGMRTALLFSVAFMLAALFYWPAFEAKRNLPDALYGAPVGLAALTAALDAWWSRRPFQRSLWVGSVVLPATVLARVIYDGLRDPTSHNLWPFEVAIAIGVGLPAALAGAAAAWILLRLLRGRTDAR